MCVYISSINRRQKSLFVHPHAGRNLSPFFFFQSQFGFCPCSFLSLKAPFHEALGTPGSPRLQPELLSGLQWLPCAVPGADIPQRRWGGPGGSLKSLSGCHGALCVQHTDVSTVQCSHRVECPLQEDLLSGRDASNMAGPRLGTSERSRRRFALPSQQNYTSGRGGSGRHYFMGPGRFLLTQPWGSIGNDCLECYAEKLGPSGKACRD